MCRIGGINSSIAGERMGSEEDRGNDTMQYGLGGNNDGTAPLLDRIQEQENEENLSEPDQIQDQRQPHTVNCLCFRNLNLRLLSLLGLVLVLLLIILILFLIS